MNSLCLPLLRDAERLDLLKLELPRVARAKDKQQKLIPVRRPFEQEVLPVRDECAGSVLAGWRSLAQARRDASSLTALLRLLAVSVSSEAMGPRPAPSFDSGRLLPWLSDRVVLRDWLCGMGLFWTKAVQPLVKENLLPAWTVEEVPQAGFCLDPFCAARFRARVDLVDAGFAPVFAAKAMPHLPCGTSLATAREWEQTFLSLPDSIRDSTEVILYARHGASGLEWLRLALREPAVRMERVLRGLVGCLEMAPPKGVHGLLTTLRHVGKPADAIEDLAWAMRGLRAGASPLWLAENYRFALATKLARAQRPALPEWTAAPHFRGTRWIMALAKRWELSWYGQQRFLSASAGFPGVREMARQIPFRRWSRERRRFWLEWVAEFDQRPSQVPKFARRWSVLRAHWPRLIRLVEKTPVRHRDEMMRMLKHGFHSEMVEKDEALPGDTLHWAEASLNAWEINSDLRLGFLPCLLPCFEPEQRRRIADSLPKLMLATKKLGFSWSFETHLKNGAATVPVLGKRLCLFILLREPKLLMKCLSHLGILKEDAGLRVASAFAEHPLASCDPGSASLKELAVMVDAASAGRQCGMPVKQRIWDHVHGIKPLHAHLQAADRYELEHAWARLAVEVLHELAARELRLLFPVKPRGAVSALTLLYLHTLDEGRRKAKRVVRTLALRLPFSRERHPVNVKWRATLPQRTAAQWLLGFHRACIVPQRGRLLFETECNPLEILHMGDYGGSCLGIGSCNQYSSLTNALDGNKQVVYARDSTGKVVARQLLALSDARTLVCFRIYPEHSSEEIRNAFIQYDQAYAAALEVPLHAEGEYEISSPMKMQWYDDGAWTPWSDGDEE